MAYGHDGRALATGLNLNLAEGRSYAIVGPSGAGKTTFLCLLAGLLSPSSGRVMLRGRPIADYALDAVRSLIGFVPQQPAIVSGTVRDNLLYGCPHRVDDEELRTLLDALRFDKDAPAGTDILDVDVGAAGQLLSGGERQRLGIARARWCAGRRSCCSTNPRRRSTRRPNWPCSKPYTPGFRPSSPSRIATR